ncbi:hypothetical protein [Bacillus haynesii]|uniref:hypothetical protein n=1 Tax=Bacillus haynesii TaxID=1925021 RepID=UPI0022806542|nr:hypothetical protein [Bacillus haynesii]MCY8222720.1 hypothetical protein [Bacillus haynesii]
MSTKREYKIVNVSNILNYSKNPRHDIGTNEIDTIKKLINKVGSQYMYNLASDIFRNGLLGANLPTLVYSSERKKYIVYEGNRRVACIKLLNDPSILTTIDNALKQRIEKLINTEKAEYSNDIYCLITNEEEAFTIMERTHSGEDKGRGLKAWTPKEKDLFKSRLKNKVTIELIIADLFEKYLKEDITEKISYTTIQRFFNNREVKKALAINSDFSNITKEKIVLIKYLIDKAIEESIKENVTLTRLFNRAREIEDFFVPLIENYQLDLTDESKQESAENINIEQRKTNSTSGQNQTTKSNPIEDDAVQTEEEPSIKIKLLKEATSNIYFTDQTINLLEKLEITNRELYMPELLDIDCMGLKVVNGIIQPNNLPGEYKVIYRYYSDSSKKVVFWQDSLAITLKLKKVAYAVPKQQTVLSSTFTNKYIDKIRFEYGDKLCSLMIFLSNENKYGKYSNILNIVSRMFLEYSFRMYASKVLKEDNQSIDDRSKSLKGLIDYCCNKIEQENPSKFVKHIQRGRRDATSKVDILQKSIHYFDVSISNEDIQNMFTNLNIYLEHLYEKIIENTFHTTEK